MKIATMKKTSVFSSVQARASGGGASNPFFPLVEVRFLRRRLRDGMRT